MYLELKKTGEAPVQVPSTPALLEPWRALLLEAADLLERRGWCQQHLVDVKGRMCTIGAMTSVWNLANGWDLSVVSEAQNRLTSVVGPLVEWNDTHGRTKTEVLKTLRSVASNVSFG